MVRDQTSVDSTRNGSRHLRVCYVAVDVPVPASKGSSTHVTEVAKGLQDLGVFVAVLSRRAGSWQPSSEKFQGFMLYRVYRGIFVPFRQSAGAGATPKQVGLLPRLYRMYLSTILALYCGLVAANLIKKHKLSVVIERETSFGAGAIASLLTGRPLVLEVNGPRLSTISSRRASVVTAYSYSMVSERMRHKTMIVDAGVNTSLFRPDLNARKEVRAAYALGDSVVIGYVGSFQDWHGIEDLVEASVVLSRSTPNVKFLLVGPNSEKTRHLVNRLGIADFFIFTGPVPYNLVSQYINAADVMVSPTNPMKSEWTRIHGPPEQFKIFEYMACRKPVVVTSVGPMLRVVTNGVSGLTVPPANPKALAAAISALVQDRENAERIASNAYELVQERYSWLEHAMDISKAIGLAVAGPFPVAKRSRAR